MNKLHYFCTVAQTGSLSKAAELLHISQPALSKAVKSLEENLGKKLIIPSGRGIAITDQGKLLAEKAAPLIEEINDLAAMDIKVELQDTLRIGTFEVFSTYFLGKIMAEEFPNSNVKISELVPGPMEAALVARQVDIGITYLPIPHKDLDFLKVTSIEMQVYGKKDIFKNYDIASVPFTAPNIPISGTPSKAKGLDGWPDDKHPRRIKYHVSMMETALDLCRRGKCVGYFPKFIVEIHNSIVTPKYYLDEIKSPLKLNQRKHDVYMIKRKSDLETSNFKKISRWLRVLTK